MNDTEPPPSPPASPAAVPALGQMRFADGYRLGMLLEPDGVVRCITEMDGIGGFDERVFLGRKIGDAAAGGLRGAARRTVWEERVAIAASARGPARYLDLRPDVMEGADATVTTTITPIRDDAGHLQAILAASHDRTPELRLEAQLRDSEAQFRGLAETLPQMVWVTAADGHAEYFSPRWSVFTGRTTEELLARGYLDLVHPSDVTALRDQARVGAIRHIAEFRLRRHDGAFRWMEARTHPIYDDHGECVRWVGGTIDVTDRRLTEDLVREQRHQLHTALSMTGMGRYSIYLRENRIDVDDRYREIAGPEVVEICARDGMEGLLSLVHTDDIAVVRRALERAAAGAGDYEVEFRQWAFRPGGRRELRRVVALGRLEFDASGPLRIVGVLDDVTDRRRQDELQLRLQKREAVGTLASGMAHDFNNVISAILSNAYVAEAELAAGDSPATSIQEIAQGARRAGDLVRRMLDVSRDREPVRERFDLAAVVHEACALVQPSVREPVALSCEGVRDDVPPMFGDPSQLHQVVLNLVRNAAQAIEGEGHIDVRLDLVVFDGDKTKPAPLPPGDYLRLQVRDDGSGIAESARRRIFDPFYTTKPQGEGTGLGLAAAQTIVRSHGGVIEVDSLEGEGTTFSVLLPAGGDERGGAAAAADDEAGQSGAGAAAGAPVPRVLFVDDEAALTMLAHRAMPYHGCQATTFTDPAEALAAFKADPDAYDVLVTDLTMPGMTGFELIGALRSVRLEFPVVLTSGFLNEDHRLEAERLAIDRIVPKPCSVDELAAAVLELVGRPAPAD